MSNESSDTSYYINSMKVRDAELLDELKRDRKSGFKKLFDTYYMPLCVYAVQLTDSFEVAEDVVQNVFLYFWEKNSEHNITSNVRNYLYLSVRNAAIASMKKMNLKTMEQIYDTEIDFIHEEFDECELLKRKTQLLDSVDKLPEGEKSAIQSVILENMHYQDAAERLGISVNTLKTQLSRALKKLRANHNVMLLFY